MTTVVHPFDVPALTPAAIRAARLSRVRRVTRNFSLGLALLWIGTVVLLALTANLLPIPDPTAIAGTSYSLPPFQSWVDPLGTDQIGRSVLSRLIFGARESLTVSLGATLLALAVGAAIGIFVGYAGGWWVHVFDFVTSSMLAFPPLILLIAIGSIWSGSIWAIAIGLAVIVIPTFARVARANTLALAPREYVLAARALGATDLRIMFRELLPSVLRALLSYTVVVVAALIVAEGSLSFLGLGIPPPSPSWGGMIAEGRLRMNTAPALVFVPGAVLFLTVLALNTIGDRLVRGDRSTAL